MAMNPISTWKEYADGTSDGATATHTAIANRQHFITTISGHTDLDSLLQILDGTTVVWETYVDVSVSRSFNHTIHVSITPGTACSGKIASSTGDCFVNIQGYSVP